MTSALLYLQASPLSLSANALYNPPTTPATLVGMQRELKSSLYHMSTPDSVRHVLRNALDRRIGNVLYAEQELI